MLKDKLKKLNTKGAEKRRDREVLRQARQVQFSERAKKKEEKKLEAEIQYALWDLEKKLKKAAKKGADCIHVYKQISWDSQRGRRQHNKYTIAPRVHKRILEENWIDPIFHAIVDKLNEEGIPFFLAETSEWSTQLFHTRDYYLNLYVDFAKMREEE
jgi:hypothetical protein